jgi:hypothetical protein
VVDTNTIEKVEYTPLIDNVSFICDDCVGVIIGKLKNVGRGR